MDGVNQHRKAVARPAFGPEIARIPRIAFDLSRQPGELHSTS
jgi:hypothetical protein